MKYKYGLFCVFFIIILSSCDTESSGVADAVGSDGASTSGTFDPTSQWDVIVRDGTVAEQGSDGSAWDTLGGAPDPFVCITVNGNRQCSRTISDTFSPSWNETLFTSAGGGSLQGGINVEYWDEDVSEHDSVCSSTMTIPSSAFAAGSVTMTCNNGLGRVNLQLRQNP